MEKNVKKRLKRTYLQAQHKLDLKKGMLFKSDFLIPGFFGWKLYVFSNLNELIAWYFSIEKIYNKSEGLEGSEIVTNYIPVCFSKVEFSNFAINNKCILKIEQYLISKNKDLSYVEKKLKSISQNTRVYRRLFDQYPAKYYAIAHANHSIINK